MAVIDAADHPTPWSLSFRAEFQTQAQIRLKNFFN